MSDLAKAIVKESFYFSGRGVVLELQHSRMGLTKGTKFVSEKTKESWIVKARVLFDHAVYHQKIFECESTEYMLMKFSSIEKKQASIDKIKERESLHIYQYLLEPVGHDSKPVEGEELKIVS